MIGLLCSFFVCTSLFYLYFSINNWNKIENGFKAFGACAKCIAKIPQWPNTLPQWRWSTVTLFLVHLPPPLSLTSFTSLSPFFLLFIQPFCVERNDESPIHFFQLIDGLILFGRCLRFFIVEEYKIKYHYVGVFLAWSAAMSRSQWAVERFSLIRHTCYFWKCWLY